VNREAEEERTMTRKHFSAWLLVLPALLIALVISLLPVGVAYADAPTPVSGTRAASGPPRNVVRQEAGGNTIVTSEITQIWTGGISGTAEVQRRQINHPNGEFTSENVATCLCTVDGITGILYVRSHGRSDPNESLGLGTWTITGGEGDLAGLHGQGTFYQEFPAPTVYEGSVHFQP
jgi:hypothetical protein